MGVGLSIAALIVFAWQAWPKLLVFAGIVGAAAWGFGRQTRVKSHERMVRCAGADATCAEQEHIA